MVREMDTVLNKKEFFRLEKLLDQHSSDLSPARRLYFAAILDNVFNRNALCTARIDSFMSAMPAGFPDSLTANLLQYQTDSYFKTGQYALAAGVDSLLIRQYPKMVDSATLADIKNSLLIHHALSDIHPQEVVLGSGAAVAWRRNSIGLLEIPLQWDSQAVSTVFDTRANISSITQTYAQKLHLHLLDVTYNESAGLTGLQFKVGLGVADSLFIGGVLVRHAVFQVMPDSVFYIAPLHIQLNVVLGFPVIAQLQEIQFYTDGRMMIPSTLTAKALHNMALDGLDPVLYLATGGDTLLYHFDTGAGTTLLYATYFNTYHSAVLKSAIPRKTMLGGAGGTKTSDTYILPSFRLGIANKTVTLDSIAVLTQKINPGERFYGNVGQDFMRQFKEFTLNFRDMYVDGK